MMMSSLVPESLVNKRAAGGAQFVSQSWLPLHRLKVNVEYISTTPASGSRDQAGPAVECPPPKRRTGVQSRERTSLFTAGM